MTVVLTHLFKLLSFFHYNITITRYIADDEVVYQRVRREIRLPSDMSTTSFEACELKITVNYFPVYTWIENGCFMQNLTSSPVLFRLVLLTEHKVLHCYTTNAVYRCLEVGQLYPSCGFSSADCRCFQVSKFQPLLGNSLNALRFHMVPKRNRWTDGRTNRQTDRFALSISCVSTLMRNKNLQNNFFK